jgi:hypothetical protein
VLYGFVDATSEVSGRLADSHALGLGTTLGLLIGDPDDRYRIHLYGSATRFVLGNRRTQAGIRLNQRLRVSRQDDLVLRLAGEHDFGETWFEGGLFWRHHF